MANVSRQVRADLALLLVSMIWGFTFLMSKAALNQVGPLTYNALRMSLGAIALCVLFNGRLRRARAKDFVTGALIGVTLCAAFTFQAVGLQHSSVAKTSFITGLYVVLVPLLSLLVVRGTPSLHRLVWLGVLLAMTGLAVLTLEGDLHIGAGDLWVLAGAAGWAVQIIAISRFAPGLDPLVLTTSQMVSAALLSSLLSVGLEHPSLHISAEVWAIGLFMGVIGIAATFSIQAFFQTRTTSTHAALIFSLESVFGALSGVLVGGEAVTGRLVLGCGLILAGMLIVELRDHKPDSAISALATHEIQAQEA